MAGRLICCGDLCADVFLRIGSLPAKGEDCVAKEMQIHAGGAAANCAICASRLGTPTEIISLVGTDPFSTALVRELSEMGVGTSHVRAVPGQSCVVIIFIDGTSERTMVSFRGANASNYGAINANLITCRDCVYVSGYSFQTENSRATAMELITLAENVDAIRALDPSYVFARDARNLYRAALAHIDFIFPNRQEARLLSGSSDVEEAAAVIRQLGPHTVVITLGADGCYIDSDEVRAFIPAVPGITAVDTTGAGDAFCGGFLTAILRGMDCGAAACAGHEAAAKIVQSVGGHDRMPQRNNARD